MSIVSFISLAEMMDNAGFNSGTPTQTGISIVCAESGRDPAAKHVNVDGSIDRGLWQINDKWHPEVSDDEAYDAVQATVAAARISSKGTNYGAWATYTGGAFTKHMEAAAVAMAGYAWKAKAVACQAIEASLQAQLLSVRDQYTSLQTQLADANAQVASEQNTITSFKNTIASLNAKITNAKTALA